MQAVGRGDGQDERAARAAEELRLLRRYHRTGDPQAREELVHRLLPLARALARRYARGNEPEEDLVQVASVGLLKAIDRFDPDRGIPFPSFAVPTIVGELKRHLRDHGWGLRVPRPLRELALAAEKGVAALSAELGRPPSTAELAARLSCSEEDLLAALAAADAAVVVSLERPSAEDPERAAVAPGREDPELEWAEARATIEQALRVLTPREREVLRLRFEEDLTQAEIAARIGVSQVQVSRIVRGAIARARRPPV